MTRQSGLTEVKNWLVAGWLTLVRLVSLVTGGWILDRYSKLPLAQASLSFQCFAGLILTVAVLTFSYDFLNADLRFARKFGFNLQRWFFPRWRRRYWRTLTRPWGVLVFLLLVGLSLFSRPLQLTGCLYLFLAFFWGQLSFGPFKFLQGLFRAIKRVSSGPAELK